MNDCGTGCPCDEDDASSVSSQSDSDQQVCCCCNFDPFDDDSPEQQIQDLSFALRKLSVMKCQMRKWRLERLQIESENRSLRLTLQEYGVDADRVLKPDPMIVHFRTENNRLQSRKEQLEDEIRDLNETLAERDCCGDNPCDAVAHLKEKMLGLRHRCAVEKRQLRETIANLQLRLQEAQDDSSCAALNRLRAKLRELMKDGNRGDQPVPSAVGKSIETLVELSKSCDELKKENERLLAEVETLKREIREDVDEQEKFMKEDDLERDTQEMKSFLKRVNSCEAEVTQMRAQLAEKDAIINDLEKKLYAEKRNSTQLEHDLDQMTVSQKALRAEIDNMKGELKDKDGKVTKLLRELRQSTAVALGMGKLESEIERLRPELYESETKREQLMNELGTVRQELSDRNDQIIRILEEREQRLAKGKSDLEATKEENATLTNKIAQLENELKRLSEIDNLNAEVGKLKAEIERLKAENERAKADMNNMEKELKSLEQVRQSLLDNNNKLMEKLKESSKEVARLSEESKELKKERDSLKSDMSNLQAKLEDEKDKAESAKKEAALLKEESNKLREDMKKQTNEAGDVKKENENLLKELKNLQNDLKKLRCEMDKLLASETALKKDLRDIQCKMGNSQNENSSLQKEKDELLNRIKSLEDALELEKKQLNEARQANESLIKGLEQQRAECQKCRNAIENLCGEYEKLKVSDANAADQSKELRNKLDEANEEKSQLAAEISKQNDCIDALNQQVEGLCENKNRLERELGDLKWQLDKLKKDMENEIDAKNQLQMELDALKDELNKLKVRRQSIQMKGELSKQQIASSDTGKLKEEVECLKKKLQKCLAEKKKSSQNVPAKSEPVEKEKSVCKSVCTAKDSTVRDEKEKTGPIAKDKSNKMIFDGCGDFVSASKDLQCEMQKQIDAVDRIREFISYVQGDTTDRPEMLAKYLASGDNNKNWSAPEIRELFERSRKLSETISKTEEEVQSLENMARALGQENNDYDGADDFNAKAWLQSLTLTELAELHDRICLLTSSMVKHDEPNCGVYEEEDEPGDVVNARIAALQRRIAEKQREAATRAAEMRRALMQEQLQLIKLSDDMNRERERNLALRLSVETDMPIELPLRGANASGTSACCARDDCLRVGCTAHR